MLGAIVGDFIGSVHEWAATKYKTFPLIHPKCNYTDDSVLTIAVGEWLLSGKDLATLFHDMVEEYPAAEHRRERGVGFDAGEHDLQVPHPCRGESCSLRT